MAILLRSDKGSALTHPELDANFTTLQSADLDSAAVSLIAQSLDNALPILDSADVTAIASGLDTALPILDSATISTIASGLDTALPILDSADVTAIRDAGGYITLTDLQLVVDSSLDFADFKTRIAAL